ncbi:hypothetical protein ACTXT7_002839 [Hymenolepis weldensis]
MEVDSSSSDVLPIILRIDLSRIPADPAQMHKEEQKEVPPRICLFYNEMQVKIYTSKPISEITFIE